MLIKCLCLKNIGITFLYFSVLLYTAYLSNMKTLKVISENTVEFFLCFLHYHVSYNAIFSLYYIEYFFSECFMLTCLELLILLEIYRLKGL